MVQKITEWTKKVECLTKHAKTHLHAAFSALTHGLIGRWVYVMRVSSLTSDDVFRPMERSLSETLIPVLTGQPTPGASVHSLPALPSRHGGMGILYPTAMRADQQAASTAISAPLVKRIMDQNGDTLQARRAQAVLKQTVRRTRADQMKITAENVLSSLKRLERRCALAAQEKSTTSWLAALPIQHHGFALNKGAFWDAIALRYGWPLRLTPLNC